MRYPGSVHNDDPGIEAWRSMLLAHAAALRAIDAELEKTGSIPLTWYDVLLELNAATGGRLRMQELADRVVLSRTRVSRLVDEMTRAGLVGKTRDDTDRRVVWAAITESGHDDLVKAVPTYMDGIRTHFSSYLTDAEKTTLGRALKKVSRAHSEIGMCPPKGDGEDAGRT